MTSYILRRLVLMVPVAFLVTVIVFVLVRLSPGDPVLAFAGEERDPASSTQIRDSLGLDQPLPVQYVAWLGARASRATSAARSGPSSGSPRRSSSGCRPRSSWASPRCCSRSPSRWSSASSRRCKRNSALDLLATELTLAGVSLPNFFLGLVLILLFALVVPASSRRAATRRSRGPGENLRRLVLPAVTLATASLAVNMRQVRSSLLDVFGQDYIRTARAKGLRERAVIARHALKNALIPVVTLIGLQVGAIIEGAIITETIFFWPGVGRLAVDSDRRARLSRSCRRWCWSRRSRSCSARCWSTSSTRWLDPRISYARRRRLSDARRVRAVASSRSPRSSDVAPRGRRATSLRRNPRVLVGGRVVLLSLLVAGVRAAASRRTTRSSVDVSRRRSRRRAWRTGSARTTSGRDVLTRVIWGARVSLSVGADLGAHRAAWSACRSGWSAGYLGGAVDLLVMRVIDALLAFPALLLAISITAALGPQIQNAMIAIGIVAIPGLRAADPRPGARGARARVHRRGAGDRRAPLADRAAAHPAEHRRTR